MSAILTAIEAKNKLSQSKQGRNENDLKYDLEKQKSYKPLRIGAFVVAGGLVTYLAGKKIVKYFKKKNADSDTSVYASLAQRYDAAMRPSGQAYWFPDDTNMTEFWSVTYEIGNNHIDFNKVAKSYKAITGRTSLKDDIKNEISTSDFAKFLKIINPNYDPKKDTDNTTEYKGWFYVTQDTDYSDDNIQIDVFIDGKLKTNIFYSNLLLTGRIVTHLSWGVMLEVKMTNSNSKIFIKAKFVKKITATELSEKLNNKFLKAKVFTL